MTTATLPPRLRTRRMLATAGLATALTTGGLALGTAPAFAGPSAASAASPASTRALGVLAADGTNNDSHTGRWGLAGLAGMVGLFGYKKYVDHRATRGTTQRVGSVDDALGGSTRL